MSELALERIRENKRTQAKRLNLARCGLTELPDELFECVWLEELILSNRIWDEEKRKWISMANSGPYNLLDDIPQKVRQIKNLTKLYAGGSGIISNSVIKLNVFIDSLRITDISVLQKLTSLQTLSLCFTSVSDISVIQKLTSLQTLDLSYTSVSDISVLQKLTSLQTLDLSDTSISDISVLQKLTSLQILSLSDTSVSDISVLQKLTSLQILSLSGSKITDFSVLQKLPSLQTLYLSGSKITDFSVLQKLTSLQTLDLRNTQINDISVLQKLPSLQTLYLSGSKISDISVLQNLPSLQTLDLSGSKITDFSVLQKLPSLQTLDLRNTQINDISVLQKLPSLQTLDLSGSKISDISVLQKLTSLQTLYLRNTQINDISVLQKLTSLQTLYLSGSKITDFSVLQKLTSLQTLDLRNTQINDISVLQKLTSLQTLDLRYTQINDISVLQKLTSLQTLDLRNTQTNDISVLQKLPSLQTLDIRYTQINDISVLQKLTSLQTLDLRYTQINDISPILHLVKKGRSVRWDEYSSHGITLYDNPLTTPPVEVVKRGNEAILNYFKDLAEEEKTVYEAKLLIVGEAGTGKTTLSRKVRDCEADMPKEAEESTRGIDIVTHVWEQEDQPNFTMKIWDFGGQDVYHGIHQIFLSKRSLYVLVLDGRIEENPHYWLQAQELFGGDSPLLVLLNQKGAIRQNVAVRELQTDYSNLREYLSINLKEDMEDVRRLGSTVEHYIRNLPHLQKGEKLPAKWVRIRKKVEELSKEENFIYLRDFQKICKEEEIAEKERQLFLSDYLHDLGVLLHFSKEPQLKDILFLNNQWTTDAIYKVLDHTKAQEPPGYFTRKDLETIWSDESYEHVFEKLLALMERFDLCYQVPGQDVFIVPQLLSADKPEGYQWKKENDLELRYRYDFLPKGIVPRLIVRLHALLQNQVHVWKRGAVFQKGEAIAEVIENFRDKYIHIRVKGHNRRRLLTIIAHQMDEINKTFQFSEKMGVNQLIPCNYSNCQCGKAFYFQLDRLLAAEKANVPELHCQNSFKMVSVQELIQGTFTKGAGLWDYRNPPYISEFGYIDELLKEGYIKEALTQLKDVVKLTPLNRSVDQLIGRYALLQQEISKGIITEEARIVASNQILHATIDIFSDVKEGDYDIDRFQHAIVKPLLPDPVHHIRIQPIHITVHGNYVQGDAQNVASSQSGDASIDQSQTQTDQSIHLHIDKLQALLQAGQELGEFSADDAEEITYILEDLKEEKEPESPREKKRWKKFLGRIRDFAGKRIEKGADTMVSEGVKEWLKEGGMEMIEGVIGML